MNLPQEIVQAILQHLPLRQLLVVALVSHSWSHLALSQLYHKVHIDNTVQRTRFMNSLVKMRLIYRQAIRAILLYTDSLETEHAGLEDVLPVLAAHCPRLETLALVTLESEFSSPPVAAFWKKHTDPSPVDLPLFPFMRQIGFYLKDGALDRCKATFSRLASVMLAGYQLQCLTHLYPIATPALFAALRTLTLSGFKGDDTLDASVLIWLQQQCPRLRCLFLRDLWFSKSSMIASLPVHTSVDSLTLSRIHFRTSVGLQVFASMYPALQKLSLSVEIDHDNPPYLPQINYHENYDDWNRVAHELAEHVLNWVVSCACLKALLLMHSDSNFILASVLEKLIHMASLGTWDCRLNQLAVDGGDRLQITEPQRLFESGAMIKQLDSLHLSSSCDRMPLIDFEDFSCHRASLFPPCTIHPDTLVNLTNLCLESRASRLPKTALSWLLHLCPKLRSLVLRGFVLQPILCSSHFPDLEVARVDLTELVIDQCIATNAEHLFFLLHTSSRLSFLTLTRVDLLKSNPKPLLDIPHLQLECLRLAAVTLDGNVCSSLCLVECSGSSRKTQLVPPSDVRRGKAPDSSNTGRMLRVHCDVYLHFVENQSSNCLVRI
ncbi:hypothetical protein DM01DRAFT_1408045 [Hesseltinella vesiculosa]|uniref:F-box domain-containing protein n=1 Tax=Hesseltinella vesiculosa TaxID=101127 RepID=A0A1X2GFM9_9FUNG|nr:hypothetical protein DM01DRAFT_1408045 [Hesseltinella vesiculosa]